MATTFHIMVGGFEVTIEGQYLGPQLLSSDEYREARSAVGCDIAKALGGQFTYAEDED